MIRLYDKFKFIIPFVMLSHVQPDDSLALE
jgi:hypothetical protein